MFRSVPCLAPRPVVASVHDAVRGVVLLHSAHARLAGQSHLRGAGHDRGEDVRLEEVFRYVLHFAGDHLLCDILKDNLIT